jgi:enolase
MAAIEKIVAEEIVDSQGIPTLKTTVYLADGSVGAASVPSGASVGKNEALELRDSDPTRYDGKGVLKAIENVQDLIFNALKSVDATDQQKIDHIMQELDGTKNKSRLGANAILSVSLAAAVAASISQKTSLYRYIAGLLKPVFTKAFQIPAIMANLIEGGKHFGQGLVFQEFLVIPRNLLSVEKELGGIKKITKSLEELVRRSGLGTRLGMEGGLSLALQKNEAAVELLKKAITEAGFSESDWAVGLDLAATTFYKNGQYQIGDFPKALDKKEFIEYLQNLCQKNNLFSLEDPLEENDWEGWKELCSRLPREVLIIGDDLTTTNLKRLEKAVMEKAISGVIVKPNQIGTLTETLEFVKQAQQARLKTIVSHRSGETEDSFIADLAVAVAADFIKIGSPLQKERLKKYERLLAIEEEIASG